MSDRRPLVALALAFAACATTPAAPPALRWRADLEAYRGHRAQLARGLWSLSLGELGLFQHYLALSSRVVELEAVNAELEAARLDLWLRRLRLGVTDQPGTDPLEPPAPPPFACARYPVGRVELLSCRGAVTP